MMHKNTIKGTLFASLSKELKQGEILIFYIC